MKNKLIRLAELVQEDFPENILATFRSHGKSSLAQRMASASEAIAFHQTRSEALWLKAGRKRSPEERCAAARAELAAFVFAYLTGDANEYADSALEALRVLGRHGDLDMVTGLVRR